jgi:hypothetical protein
VSFVVIVFRCSGIRCLLVFKLVSLIYTCLCDNTLVSYISSKPTWFSTGWTLHTKNCVVASSKYVHIFSMPIIFMLILRSFDKLTVTSRGCMTTYMIQTSPLQGDIRGWIMSFLVTHAVNLFFETSFHIERNK